MGNYINLPLRGRNTLSPFSILDYCIYLLVRTLQRYLPVRDWDFPFIYRPQAVRPRDPVSHQVIKEEDDTTPQAGTGLTSTQDKEDIPPQGLLPQTLLGYLCSKPSVDHEPNQPLGGIQTRDSPTVDKPDSLPGPEDSPDSKEIHAQAEIPEPSTNRLTGMELRENKEGIGTVSLEVPECKSRGPRPSAFKLVHRKGLGTELAPMSGKLKRKKPLVVRECWELCPIWTRDCGQSRSLTPELDLKLKEDDAVPGPASSARRGLVYSPSVQGTSGHPPSTYRALGRHKSIRGMVGPSTSVQGVLGPSTYAKKGVQPVRSHEGVLRQSTSPQRYPRHSTFTKTKPRHVPSKKEAIRPILSLEQGLRLSPSPQRSNRCSKLTKRRMTHATSAQEGFRISPIKQKELKHFPLSKRSSIPTPFTPVSLTLPRSVQGDLEPSTSPHGYLQYLPSARGAVETVSGNRISYSVVYPIASGAFHICSRG